MPLWDSVQQIQSCWPQTAQNCRCRSSLLSPSVDKRNRAAAMLPPSSPAVPPLARGYSLSKYSPGTSSCGTSCVRTSFSSLPPACSTPVTASASNAFPSSINSATLSESAPSMLDNPCESPDCPPLALSASGANASVSTLWLFLRTRVRSAAGVFAPAVVFLPRAFVFTAAFFKVGFFFANFFLGVPLFLASFFLTVFFIGFPFFPANPFGFVRFLFSFVLSHTRSLPPAHACPRNRARSIARKPTGPVPSSFRNTCRPVGKFAGNRQQPADAAYDETAITDSDVPF